MSAIKTSERREGRGMSEREFGMRVEINVSFAYGDMD